jgi:hypothetical protein
MNRTACRIAGITLLCTLAVPAARGEDEKYTLKTTEAKAPAELKDEVATLLEPVVHQVLDGKGQLFCEVWFRKSVPAKATEAQVQNGLTYREIEQTTLLGAIRFAQKGKDYRGQEVPAGVYTLRLAIQPQDGDHMGTSPHPEFCLLVKADRDTKPTTMPFKSLVDVSAKSIDGNHPAIFLLFPVVKPSAKAELADQGTGHWVVRQELKVEVNGKEAKIGIGLTVVGHSASG